MYKFQFTRASRDSKVAFFAALFMFLLVNAGDVHSHLCLDGQEPPVSVHFENLDGHPDHENEGGEEAHNDYEFDLVSAFLQAKSKQSPQLDLTGFLPAVFVVHPQPHPASIIIPADNLDTRKPAVKLPPLRAPPVIA